MKERSINIKIYSRSIIAIMLIAVWILVALSGLILWLAPAGHRSGQMPLLFDMTKNEWKNIHFWVAVATFIITIIHMIIDWKALRGVIRYLVSVHRDSITTIK